MRGTNLTNFIGSPQQKRAIGRPGSYFGSSESHARNVTLKSICVSIPDVSVMQRNGNWEQIFALHSLPIDAPGYAAERRATATYLS